MGCLKLSYYERESTLAKEPVFLLKGREKNGNTEKIYKDYYPFGMEMPGRSLNPTEYRFSFNGKEKMPEITGSNSHLDFEARIYDSRIGRTLSLDPLTQKFPWQSPYSMFANNPILFVDKDGKENVIYLVLTKSANEHLSKQDVQDIVNNANKNYEAMGLNTRVKLWDKEEDFHMGYADKTDGLAVLGEATEVKDYIKGHISSEDWNNEEFGDWNGGVSNPERSGLNVNVVALDAASIGSFSKEMESSAGEAGGFLITHGTGHNAGFNNHATDLYGFPQGKNMGNSAVMGSGGFIYSAVTGNAVVEGGRLLDVDNPDFTKLPDFLKKDKNSLYIKQMEGAFGTKKSTDNYDYNKRKANQKVQHY